MKEILAFSTLCLFVMSCTQPSANNSASTANPASMYCIQNGGKSEIRTLANGNQTGFCLFNVQGKKSECEEFAFMRGECKPQ